MNKNFSLKMGIVLTTILLPAYALATSQTISADQSEYVVNLGESFDIPLSYTSDDANLTGLGMTLLFDSNKLVFEGFSSSLEQDLLAADTVAKTDASDLDKASVTDNLANIAWVSLSGNWPGQTSTPLTVARFKVLDTATSDTVINVTGSAASNSTLSAEPIVVTVGKIEAQSATTSALTSTSTSTEGGGGSLSWYLLPFLLMLTGLRAFGAGIFKR